MDLLPYLLPLQDSGPAPSLPSLLRVAGMSEGCWVAWHYDESYRQRAMRIFGAEIEALRWAIDEQAGHRVTFVPWGQSVEEAEENAP